jgi:hypothetical protein
MFRKKYSIEELDHMRVLISQIWHIKSRWSMAPNPEQVELYLRTYMMNGTSLKELMRHKIETEKKSSQ